MLKSTDSAQNGGIGVLSSVVMPNDPRDDFSEVSVLDQEGEYAWPITLVTYTHVRGDLSFIEKPQERALLVAFLKALYRMDFVDICKEKYGFALATGPALKLAGAAIDILEAGLGSDVVPWTFEEKPTAIDGAGEFVLSSARGNLGAWERRTSETEIQALKDSNAILQEKIAELSTKFTNSLQDGRSDSVYNKEEEAKVMAALILGSLSAVLVLAMMLVLGFRSSRPEKTDVKEDV
jgi:hypothetical protein